MYLVVYEAHRQPWSAQSPAAAPCMLQQPSSCVLISCPALLLQITRRASTLYRALCNITVSLHAPPARCAWMHCQQVEACVPKYKIPDTILLPKALLAQHRENVLPVWLLRWR